LMWRDLLGSFGFRAMSKAALPSARRKLPSGGKRQCKPAGLPALKRIVLSENLLLAVQHIIARQRNYFHGPELRPSSGVRKRLGYLPITGAAGEIAIASD
jgi:hypothetical protein